jgi:hypothetical protein
MKKFLFLVLGLSLSCSQGIKQEKICDLKSKGFALATLFFAQRNESFCLFQGKIVIKYSKESIVFPFNVPVKELIPNIYGAISSLSVTPSLPSGLIFNSSTGSISGTPNSVTPETNYIFSAKGQNNSTGTFTMKIRISGTTAIRVYGQSGDFTCNATNNDGLNTCNASSTPSANSLNNPMGISGDFSGGIYIGETANNRFLYFKKGSTTASRVYGQYGDFTCKVANRNSISCAAGTTNANTINNPRNVFYGLNDNLYLADLNNNRVLSFNGESIIASGIYGQSLDFSTSANTPVNAERLNGPQDIIQDLAGGLYIADANNHRVLYYNQGSTTATRVYGQNGSFTTNTSNTTADNFFLPVALALDSAGGLYVADSSNNRVLHFPKNEIKPDRVYGQFGSYTCSGLNSQNNTGNCISGNPSADSLRQPKGIAVDSSDNLYISDSLNFRVLFYPGVSTTATRVFGQAGSFTTRTVNNGGLSANSLNEPARIYIDTDGGLYVADQLNNRVLYY